MLSVTKKKNSGTLLPSAVCNNLKFLLQTSHAEKEQALQRKLEEVCEELRTTQSRNGSLQATLDKAQQDSGTLSGQ